VARALLPMAKCRRSRAPLSRRASATHANRPPISTINIYFIYSVDRYRFVCPTFSFLLPPSFHFYLDPFKLGYLIVQNEVIFEDCNLEEGGGPLPDYHLERLKFKDPLVPNTDLVNGMTGNQVGHNLENISIFPDSTGSRPLFFVPT
jgi:hypothetical protein